MKKVFKILSIIIGFCGLIFACTKYQDDPFISVYSTSKRLSKNWILVSFKINGIDSTIKYTRSYFQPHTSTLPILSIGNNSYSITDTDDQGGDITFDNKKAQISFNDANLNQSSDYSKNYLFPLKPTTFNILELTNSVFKISITINKNYYELIFSIYE